MTKNSSKQVATPSQKPSGNLFNAICERDIKAVGQILDKDPTFIKAELFGYSSLAYAIKQAYSSYSLREYSDHFKNSYAVVELLLQRGADPNCIWRKGLWSQYSNPLTIACINVNPDIANLLVRYGAKFHNYDKVTFSIETVEGHNLIYQIWRPEIRDTGSPYTVKDRLSVTKIAMLQGIEFTVAEFCLDLIIKKEPGELLQMISSGILDPWRATIYPNDITRQTTWSVMEYCNLYHKFIVPRTIQVRSAPALIKLKV